MQTSLPGKRNSGGKESVNAFSFPLLFVLGLTFKRNGIMYGIYIVKDILLFYQRWILVPVFPRMPSFAFSRRVISA